MARCHETSLRRHLPWFSLHRRGPGQFHFFLSRGPLDRWTLPRSLIGVIAIVGGIFLLKGRNWARWLLLAWLAFHVVVSALNSLSGSVVHLVLLVAIAYFLLTPPDSRYFSSAPLK
jgi:hypothetical protein